MSNTLLKRLGSLRSDEMASNGAQTLTTLDAVLGGALSGVPKMGPNLALFSFTGALGGSEGGYASNGHSTDAQHDGFQRKPPPRLVVCPEVCVGCAPAEASRRLVYYHFYLCKGFLPPIFAPAS